MKENNERLQTANRKLEDQIAKLTKDPQSKGLLKENEALKKENGMLKEEIKKALQIHTVNQKLKDLNKKLEEQLKLSG